MVRFDDFHFDPDNAVLRNGDRVVKIRPQALKILSMLVASRGELVTRERIRQEVWGADTFVDFNQGLNVCIRQIRDALGDDPDAPRYIETVPKFGYRFIAPVQHGDPRLASPESAAPATIPPEAPTVGASPAADAAPATVRQVVADRRRHLPRSWGALGAGVVVLVMAAVIMAGVYRWAPASRTDADAIRAIAVLPLANLSTADQDYFADGMTDALITNLAQIRALKVISRTSVMAYKTARKPLPEVGRELGVDAVVDGSVQRVGDRVRVNVQLLRTATDQHLWAQTYERSVGDVLTLQHDISRAVAVAVRAALTPEERSRLTEARPVDPSTYEAYAKGRYYRSHDTPSSWYKAREQYEEAIRLTPDFALAHVGLGELFVVLAIAGAMPADVAFQHARTSAERALRIDDRLGEPYVALAAVRSAYDWDWPGTEDYFRRAIERAPNYAPAHAWYAEYLAVMGRVGDAVGEARRAQQLDPLSPVVHRTTANMLYLARDFDAMVRQCEAALELFPDLPDLYRLLSMAHLAQGRTELAAQEAERSERLSPGSTRAILWLAYVKASTGEREQAQTLLTRLDTPYSTIDPYGRAAVHASLQNHERALALLEEARAARYTWIQNVHFDPRLDQLRGDPRFEAFRRRIATEDGVAP